MFFDAVLTRDMMLVFNGTPDEVEEWLVENGLVDKHVVCIGELLKVVSVSEYLSAGEESDTSYLTSLLSSFIGANLTGNEKGVEEFIKSGRALFEKIYKDYTMPYPEVTAKRISEFFGEVIMKDAIRKM